MATQPFLLWCSDSRPSLAVRKNEPILTFKCLHTPHGLYIRCLYHSGSAFDYYSLVFAEGKFLFGQQPCHCYYTRFMGTKLFQLDLPLYEIYKRCLYHSRSALLLILHKRVHLLLQNFQTLDLKPLNGGMLGCKKGCAPLQFVFQVFTRITWDV